MMIRPILVQFSPNYPWKSMKHPEFNSDQGAEALRLPFMVGLSVKKENWYKMESWNTHGNVENKGGG